MDPIKINEKSIKNKKVQNFLITCGQRHYRQLCHIVKEVPELLLSEKLKK
jgi:hypothetical protein